LKVEANQTKWGHGLTCRNRSRMTDLVLARLRKNAARSSDASFLVKIHNQTPRKYAPYTRCAAGPKLMKIALYWILFLGRAIGDGTILSHLIPLFRRLVTSGVLEKVSPKILIFAVLGVTLIQVCYWLNQYWFATLRLNYNPLLGHFVLFLSRLNFIFAAGVFSAVYLVRFNELDIGLETRCPVGAKAGVEV
jgi:hypothetical protein